MHVIIQHKEGVITGVKVTTVAGQLRRSVPVATDAAKLAAYLAAKLAAYLAANAGKTVLQRDFEKATQVYEQRLLVVIDGVVVEYPVNTVVLAVSKLAGGATALIDLLQNWQYGKYRIVDNALVPATSWAEPTVEIPGGD
jgi:hypothetical protein